jgi:hypothetical protein
MCVIAAADCALPNMQVGELEQLMAVDKEKVKGGLAGLG